MILTMTLLHKEQSLCVQTSSVYWHISQFNVTSPTVLYIIIAQLDLHGNGLVHHLWCPPYIGSLFIIRW